MELKEKSVTALLNGRDWQYYRIENGKAQRIPKPVFDSLVENGATVNQPLYTD